MWTWLKVSLGWDWNRGPPDPQPDALTSAPSIHQANTGQVRQTKLAPSRSLIHMKSCLANHENECLGYRGHSMWNQPKYGSFPTKNLRFYWNFNCILHNVSIDKIPNIKHIFPKLWKLWPFEDLMVASNFPAIFVTSNFFNSPKPITFEPDQLDLVQKLWALGKTGEEHLRARMWVNPFQ